MAKKGKPDQKRDPNNAAIATNRRATHDFTIGDVWECGIVLVGSEVKSLREANVRINEAYARVKNNELWLYNLHVAPYSHSGTAFAHDPDRPKKLLANRREINAIRIATDNNGMTLVPLKMYFKNGRAKLEIGSGRRKKTEDKRRDIKARDADLEAKKAMSERRRSVQ